ncbi:hypothetical protein OG530_01460 [Streptomyces decoyicus]|uniref:hypothetical protein n=1 Tax=Streptomyces decoyicus TaxID=249567 RepID=UPI002E198CCE
MGLTNSHAGGFEMASDLRLSWRLTGSGWADCAIADEECKAHLTASCISNAPEGLLNAVGHLLTGQVETRAQFEAEPTAYRWIFYRQDTTVWIRIVELRHGALHDNPAPSCGAAGSPSTGSSAGNCHAERAAPFAPHGRRGRRTRRRSRGFPR